MAEQKPSTFDRSKHQPIPFWRDIRVLQVLAQIAFLIGVVIVGYLLYNSLVNNLAESNIVINFRMVERPFGTMISEGTTDFQPGKSSNLDALIVGLKNTLRVVIVGLIGATILGILLGIGLLSGNFLVRTVTQSYVELFRNTPLLVQLYFIYRGLRLVMPFSLKDSIELPGPLAGRPEILGLALPKLVDIRPDYVFLNRRALNFPLIEGTDTANRLYITLAIGLAIGIGLWVWRLRVMERTGQPARTLRWFLPPVIAFGVVGWILAGTPFSVDYPELQGLNFQGGDRLSIEYITLTLGLILYTAAFIADIVRAGIQAVPFGQIEAARAQGFGGGQTLRLIVLPQAMRLIIPPLGNQYLNLAKNSSLGIAVSFFDVYNVSNEISNVTGQSVAVFAIMMIIYLSMSLTISLIMNIVNNSMRLKERRSSRSGILQALRGMLGVRRATGGAG